MNKLIERKIYIDKIKGFIDTEQVKIITGIRRCGKSEILKLVKQEILKKTDEEHMIFINFEDLDFADLTSYKELNKYITEKIKDSKKHYIFLDEIQMVEGWQKVVASLRLKNTDTYITGSNAQLLSGEFATLLSGRYISFEVNTLSFAEFISFRKEYGIGRPIIQPDIIGDISKPKNRYVAVSEVDELDEYIRIGGFPLLSTTNFTPEQARQIVTEIQYSAVFKDVVARNKIKNVPLLEKIIAYIYDTVGNLVTIKKITDYIKSNGGSADPDTVSSYVGYLEKACIISKVSRYDIKGKKLLESNDKYYLADHSLQYTIRDMKRTNLPGILENIVYNELIRRDYKVYVGKMSKDDNREIDFVAERINGGEKIYVQVCTEFSSKETMDREFTPLVEIKDHYPKYVVTLDKYWQENRSGVVGIHLKDFLLKETL